MQIAIMTLVVNFRHIFYGLSFLDRFEGRAGKRYMAFARPMKLTRCFVDRRLRRCDEKKFYFLCGIFKPIYWVLGSVIGSLAGALITFDTTGMDFAMTALFIVIFLDQWKAYPSQIPALIGLGCTLRCSWLSPRESGHPVHGPGRGRSDACEKTD